MSKLIMPLRTFSLGDGRVANPGTVEEVPDSIAHAAHSFGNARILTNEEAQAAHASGPPADSDGDVAQDRDPKIRKR